MTMATSSTSQPLQRTLAEIAREIGNDWHAMRRPHNVTPRGIQDGHPAHAAYFAMRSLRTTDLSTPLMFTDEDDDGGTAADVVRSFLQAAGPWHGLTATRVKAELADALTHHDVEHHIPSDLSV